MKKTFSRILNKIRVFIPFLDREETIEQWARKNGINKKIEKLYNPANPAQDDKAYLDQLHNDDNIKERDD